MSVAGGLPRAVERAVLHRCDAFQIFAKNANQWRGRAVPTEEIREFRFKLKASGPGPVVSHASYLINLATANPALRRQSFHAMGDELDRAEARQTPTRGWWSTFAMIDASCSNVAPSAVPCPAVCSSSTIVPPRRRCRTSSSKPSAISSSPSASLPCVKQPGCSTTPINPSARRQARLELSSIQNPAPLFEMTAALAVAISALEIVGRLRAVRWRGPWQDAPEDEPVTVTVLDIGAVYR
jgi:hypothetical protein